MSLGLEVDIVALIVLFVGAIIAWVKMQQEIKNNHELQKIELAHVMKLLGDLKDDFKNDLETLKDDIKSHIISTNELSSKALDDTKAELKEDINRLERKQAESNRIKERLASVEFFIENMDKRVS